MKKTILKAAAVVTALALLLAMAVTVGAAEGQTIQFSLETDEVSGSGITKNGDYDISAPTGAEITVTYRITNLSDKKADTATTQDQILYDHNFFELVSGSNRILSGDYGDAFSTSAPVDSADSGYDHYVYFNSTTDASFKGGSGSDIGTFTLKVIAPAGTSTVRHTETIVTRISAAGEISHCDCVTRDLKVTVKNAADAGQPVSVSGIALDKSAVSLEVGETETLTASVTPADASYKAVIWISDNNAAASVDADGIVTAKAKGTAVITAKTVDGGKTASCTVTVTATEPEPEKDPTPEKEPVPKKEPVPEKEPTSETPVRGGDAPQNTEKDPAVSVTPAPETAAAENPFADIRTGKYYYDAVLWAAAQNITKGTDAAHFSPDAPTTRAQVVTFLWRAAGCPEPALDASRFADVKAGSFYEKAVAWAVKQGITKGTSDTAFSPDAVCTRGQIVTFLARFAGVQDTDTESVFRDVKTTDYFAAAVKWAKDNGVTSGTTATTFSPDADCTRAQVVTFLYRQMVR